MLKLKIEINEINSNILDINVELETKKSSVDELILKSKIEKDLIQAISSEITKKSSYAL